MQIKISKKVFTIFSVLIIAVVTTLALDQTQIKQIFFSRAQTVTADWYTTQSASTACNSAGDVVINVTFTNTETDPTQIMIVTVTDQQTNKTINLGTVKAGQTVTGTINSGKSSLAAGEVVFTMAWSYDTSETDTRTANYEATADCPAPSPSATPSPSKTPTPTQSPTPSPTTAVSPVPSASPTVCPTPGTVSNINIQCPYCTPSPTSSS